MISSSVSPSQQWWIYGEKAVLNLPTVGIKCASRATTCLLSFNGMGSCWKDNEKTVLFCIETAISK